MNSMMKNDEMEVDDSDSVTICRLCAEMTSSKSFIPLYTDDKQEQLVVKQINRLISNLISPNDGLPQDVCLLCAENVEKFYTFVSNIIETQNKLRRIMQLPEIKEMGCSEEGHHISFLNDDHTSPYALTHADDGPEIIASKDTNIRLNGNSKFSPSRENKTRTEESSFGNADLTETRSATKTVPSIPDNGTTCGIHPLNRPIQLYRCSPCDVKYGSREECLRHIASYHKGTQKAASKNTIFVTLPSVETHRSSSGSVGTPQNAKPHIVLSKTPTIRLNRAIFDLKKSTTSPFNEVSQANKLAHVSNLPTSSTPRTNIVLKTSTALSVPSVTMPHAQSVSSTATSKSSTTTTATKSVSITTTTEVKDQPKKPNPRHRKVLAIDGFYKEVSKRVGRFVCAVCGRSMVSKFVFVRHLHEHDWSNEEAEDEKKKSKQNASQIVSRAKPGYCSPCKMLVQNIVRHKMFHVIIELEKKHPHLVHLLEDTSEQVKDALLGMQSASSNENTSPAVFHDVDDFVELLVVDPDMVEMDMQEILKSDGLILNDRSQAVVVSSADETIICVKEDHLKEEHVLTEEEIEDGVIEQADETVFLENYEISQAMIDLPALADADSAILFKCSNCEQTFDSEKTFQVHYCVIEDATKPENETFHEYLVDTAEPSVRIREYRCNLCNRSFKSPLVFRLHAAQHKNSTLCIACNSYFPDSGSLAKHTLEMHPNRSAQMVAVDDENVGNGEKQCDVCDVCGKITDNLKQHEMYHTIRELEYCKEKNKKFLKKWFFCHKCNKKIFSEANFLFHVAKHEGSDTVNCRQCDFVASNIQDYNMHITTHTGGKYFICNDCDKCFFTRSAISDHVLIHMEGTRYMCEICGKRFKTSRSNAQHKLLQHKKYFRCNRCNRGFTHEAKLNSHYNICQVINQEQNDSKVFETVERFFCNICNSNIKSSSEISILFHRAKHDGKDGVECKFCNFLCKNACIYKNHLLIHTNQRPYACTQCTKSFRTKGCLVQHMLVHGDEYKYTCEYCGKKSKKLTTHVNHVNIHTDTKPYKCPDCDRPFRQLSDMKKHRRTHLKYKTEAITITELPYMSIKTEVEDMMAAESIQHLQLA